LTASTQATADIVALAATVSNDGIARTPGTAATGAFSVAAINVGAAANVIASVDTGGAAVNATFAICETNAQALCLQPPSPSVNTSFTQGQPKTFSIFVTSNGTLIPLDPARTRAFVRFKVTGSSVGATSVAVQTQITLGYNGGSLQLGSVNVSAAAGSIVSGTDFAASPTSAPAPLPLGFQALSSAYDIALTNPAGVPDNGLNAPVNVTLPYGNLGVTDASRLTVLHYDANAGAYQPTTIQNIDTANQTITFDSRRFSAFVLAVLNAVLPNSTAAPNFTPSSNGFAIRNCGEQYLAPGGNCVGMSSFALWYYQNRGGGLFSRYPTTNNSVVSCSPFFSPPPLRASVQDLVATLAHVNQSVYWSNLLLFANVAPWQQLNPAPVVFALRSYLAIFRVPVVLVVGSQLGRFEHAVLVYGYDQSNFLIYDPNYPGQVKTLSYNSFGFGTYDGTYTRFAVIGVSSFGSPATYQQLASQADGGFAGATNLTVTSPAQGATVNSRQTQLSGSLAANVNGQSQVQYWQNGLSAFNTLGTSPFSKTIDVASGLNTVVVLAGVPAYDGHLSSTLLNAVAKIVTFNGQSGARFRATLNWNQANTDVDQYVTEPTGATAWYAASTTASGLKLDFDNTSGFGPENTTIEAASTPIPGIYRVRLHYYSDHLTRQVASGQVTITVNERAVNQVGPLTKQWSISVSNPNNDQPGAPGPDWVDIADVNVVSGTITLR
jgi:uncharacterized protein YfaP (DUF2135 family)